MVFYKDFVGRETYFMKKTNYMIWLGIAAAVGTTAGIVSDPQKPAKGGIIGAAAFILAGSVAAGIYHYITEENVPYYSASSPMYEEIGPV